MARVSRPAHIRGTGRVLKLVAQLVQSPLVLGARADRARSRGRLLGPTADLGIVVRTGAKGHEVTDVAFRAGSSEQMCDVVQSLSVPQSDDPAGLGERPGLAF